jgi:hemolysin activation/secretion protein
MLRPVADVALKFLYVSLMSASLAGGAAYAQVAPDVSDPALELEREQERQRRDEERDRFERREETPAPETTKTAPLSTLCIEIEDISVSGVSLLAPHAISTLVAGLAPGCITQAQIEGAMASIDKAYADKGFVTTRTYIPEQDVKASRQLKLIVVEGTLESIELVDKAGPITGVRRKLLLGTAFPNNLPRTFQLRDLEQAVDQLDKPASVDAKLRLEPGENPGGSKVVIERASKDRFRGYAAFNNYGSPGTGERQVRLSTSIEGLLSASDIAGITYIGGRDSNALSTAFSVPFGYNTFSVSASYSDYLIPLTDISELFGDSQTYSLGWTRVVARDSASKTSLSASLDYRLSDRFINGLRLTPQNAATLNVSLSQVREGKAAKWAFDISPSYGLDAFNATEDPSTEKAAAHAQTFILRGGVSRAGKGGSMGKWVTDLRVQLAPEGLYSSEQVALGARSISRGFEQPVFSADIGTYVRQDGEFKVPGTAGASGGLAKWAGENIRLFAFADAGAGYAYAGDATGWASGIGGGLRVKAGKAGFTLAVEKSLSEKGSFEPFRGEPIVRLEVSGKLF